ncbi:MAG: hypothetical protein ABIQ74_00755 [Chitinophagales bacterium]
MKTKIFSIVLLSAFMLSETSCFIKVRGKKPRAHAKVRVRADAPLKDKQLQDHAYRPFKDVPVIAN